MTDAEWAKSAAAYKASGATGFEFWMAKVDKAILAKTSGLLSSEDLTDQPYMDWFEDGMSASRAAAKAVKNEINGEVGG